MSLWKIVKRISDRSKCCSIKEKNCGPKGTWFHIQSCPPIPDSMNSGISVPKPFTYTNQKARCGTSTENCDSYETEQSQDDRPIPDMENPFQKDRRQCILCKFNITPNYKNTKLLSQFISMYTGKTYGRHITGLCKQRQEQVMVEIAKAQNAGLMPYYLKDPAFMQDPSLFNPDTPFRNHPY